jgi:3-oxoacyl-[acyl-carrier protein] reductase
MTSAVVTGAGRGLGKAIAARLAADGYQTACVDLDAQTARATADAIGGTAHQCDVADRVAVEALAATIGPVQVLVNNAGIWSYGSIVTAAAADLERVVAVNLMGMLNCTRAFVPALISSGGGAIINLSSVAVAVAATMVEVYPATKAAVETLTRQLAQELGPSGIRVNAIGPGSILTEGTAAAYEGNRHAERAAMVPLRRVGTPADVANAVSFLVSEQASYISGQILYVDGGVTAAH